MKKNCKYCENEFNGRKEKLFCNNVCYGKWFSKNKTGKNNFWHGKIRPEISKRMIENPIMKNLESREKMKKTLKSKYNSGELKIWNAGLNKEDSRVKSYAEKLKRPKTEKEKQIIKLNHWSRSDKREEVAKKVSETKLQNYAIGKTKSALKGKKVPIERIEKQIRTKIINGTLPKGENNPMFNNWSSLLPYDKNFNKEFKRFVKDRDGSCLLCNLIFEDLKLLNRRSVIHHVNYDKSVTCKENSATLCTSCHGKTQINRNHWTKFFQSLLAERYGYKYSENGEIILEVENNEIK